MTTEHSTDVNRALGKVLIGFLIPVLELKIAGENYENSNFSQKFVFISFKLSVVTSVAQFNCKYINIFSLHFQNWLSIESQHQ